MRASLTQIASLLFLACSLCADEGRVLTLTLPRPLATGETTFIELKLGAVERAAEIEVATTSGRFLGVVSPFGIRSGEEAGTYTIPLPTDAFLDGRVSLRLTLSLHGQAKRAPTTKEVRAVRLKIAPAAQARKTIDG